MKSKVAGVLLGVSLFCVTVVHAQSSSVPIGDPYTDTVQLWGELATTINFLLSAIMSGAGSLASDVQHPSPVQHKQSAPQSLAAAAAAFETTPATTAASAEIGTAAGSGEPISYTSSSGIIPATIPPLSTDTPDYVTQSELSQSLGALSDLLTAEFGKPSTTTPPQNVAADGNGENPFAAVNAINNLSDVTISNSTIDAASIPDLSGSYLSLNGGTVTGALADTAASSSYFLGGLGIGTTTAAVPLEVQDTAATSTALYGSNIVSDGSFTSNPSSTWTLGSGWSWDSTNSKAQYTGTGGPISSLTIATGGTGYLVGDTVTISGGTADATYSVTAVTSTGAVTALSQLSAGTAYSSSGSSAVATTGGTGSGLTVLITMISNGLTLKQTLASSAPSGTYYSVSYDSWITGTTYQVSFSISNYSGNGEVQVGIGTVSNDTQLPYYFKSGNYTITLTSSAPVITFTPTADFNGEISNVSVAPITPAPASLRVTDTNGDSRFELRSGGSVYDTFLGVDAGRNSNDTVDGYNTAVGYDALFSLEGAFNNVAVGDAALYADTTGGGNTAVGESALQYVTTGSTNTALGFVALGADTTGGTNTAVGNFALGGNTTGGQNTAIGVSAMQSNSIGGQNTALGQAAMYLNTVGNRNTALGWNAMYANTTGSDNTALGYNAFETFGTGGGTGGSNTAIGEASLSQNTTGGSNTGVGYRSMKNNLTGASNAALGNTALENATTSSDNTAVGVSAMQGGTVGTLTISGTNDVGLGWQALENYIDGSNNTAVGVSAMLQATTSSSSVAVGYKAGNGKSSNDAYTGLTALGYQTGMNLSNGSNFNTLIGYQAGYNVTTGADNILIGSATSSTGNANLTTGSQNVQIGENEQLASTTANGQLDIQNILYGTNNTAVGSALSTGNIGIATTTPWARLSITGPNTTAGSLDFVAADSTNKPLFSIFDNGYVGVGTSTPVARFEVAGPDSASTTAFAVVNTASTTAFAVYDNGNATYAGSIFQSSDERLKTNIQSLDASSSLSLIDQLNPVTFNWIDPNRGTQQQLGFIAQQVLPILPDLISTTSATALTPDGTLSLNYIGLISPIVSAIQALSAEIASVENTVAGFAQSIVSNDITASQELCVGTTCVTPTQFQAMVAAAGQIGSAPVSNSGDATDTPPVIQINGNNPAIIQTGTTYSDLGATITGPQADLNLGIQTYVNGTAMTPVQIDTSEAATDTIDYVVTDQNGMTSTSTRTVIIEAPESPSIVPSQDASTSTATTTSS